MEENKQPAQKKPKPKPKATPPPKLTKRSTLKLSPEYTARIKVLTETTGLTLQTVVQSLIESPLAKVEAGGTIVINPSTGAVTIGNAPLAGAPPPPVAVNQERNQMGKVRKMNMSQV